MTDKTGIEWTDATWNPLRGCSRVSEGCRNCYAESIAARFSFTGAPYEGLARRDESGAHWTNEIRLIEHMLDQPLRWQKPRRIFVNSMSDLFHEKVSDQWIDWVFAIMALAPQHIFQVLTKRPARMLQWFKRYDSGRDHNTADFVADRIALQLGRMGATGRARTEGTSWNGWPLRNVWLGVSVEDQATANERIPLLLQTPAPLRFISAEPLLGPIKISWALDWVIVGGESGAGARPMNPNWARSLRDQCEACRIPYFFKQWGHWLPDSQLSRPFFDDKLLESREYFADTTFWAVGKARAGALLDGVAYKAFPA